ncbi:hypothetical protein R5H32_05715 [Defluviimonas sp. D31]|uniref:hypothetical protein n=1 Tax=Defluviimonas sp. D31 TaxID=3083253 RepID=UPI00296F37B2|nr:hypothetical protein [Defluviimonas sp. D31]MDW4548846.1 hypothetical protein [Defluviimonas sp. D31]
MTTPPETYLPDVTYFGLVDELLNVAGSFDPRSRVIELLGEIANVWPESCHSDRD